MTPVCDFDDADLSEGQGKLPWISIEAEGEIDYSSPTVEGHKRYQENLKKRMDEKYSFNAPKITDRLDYRLGRGKFSLENPF